MRRCSFLGCKRYHCSHSKNPHNRLNTLLTFSVFEAIFTRFSCRKMKKTSNPFSLFDGCAHCNVQGGPYWEVPTGRRDGLISRSSEALNNIPPPFGNFSTLQRLFANQGLDLKDLVLLSGEFNIIYKVRKNEFFTQYFSQTPGMQL